MIRGSKALRWLLLVCLLALCGWQGSGYLTYAVGDARYAKKASSNTYTATQQFNSQVSFTGKLLYSFQTFSQNGGTIGTIATASTSAAGVEVTGTGGGTLSLPTSPVTNQVYLIRNTGSSSFTLSGGGNNIDGATSQLFSYSSSVGLQYNGTEWKSITLAPWQPVNWGGGFTAAGAFTFAQRMLVVASNVSSTSTLVTASNCMVRITASGITVTLPSSPTDGMVLEIKNASAGNSTLAPNSGQTLESGGPNITLAAGACRRIRYQLSTTTWEVLGAYL